MSSAPLSEENPNPILELHISGVVTYMNPAAQATFPDLPSLGLRHPVLNGLPEIVTALRDRETASVRREIRASGNVYDQIITIGKASEFIRIWMTDVTHRIRTEAQLQMANMSLVKVVTDLKQSKHRLYSTESQLIQSEKMSAIGQLASGIAHEVKNPLAILLKGVSYLKRELQLTKGEPAKVLGMMQEAILRADQIIHDLLDFSRPAPLELKPVSIAGVLDAALELVQQQLTMGNIRVAKDFAPDLKRGLLDENRMKQAFINLILNAFRAMPHGGQLTLRAYGKTLTEQNTPAGGGPLDIFQSGQSVLVCEVHDTGHGIPADILPNVFEPFFTTNPSGRGTGLGLSITKTIIEQHQGGIWIASEEGRGTTVIVMLPVPKPAKGPSAPAPRGRARRPV